MCLAVPGKILEIDFPNASVDLMGVSLIISIELLDNLKIGDYVLVHAGCAIQKLDTDEALNTLDLFKDLEEIIHDR